MWLMCSECGATLPSETARCPVCGRQPAPRAEPPPRRRLVLGLVLVAALAIGVVAALVVVNAPDFSTVASAVTQPFG